MSMINIRRDNSDPFYRYKMPPITSKIEGRGNGIKTVITNVQDVARALSRPPSYVVKYFGFELGAQTSINDEKDRYIVNGVHEPSKLQDSLDGFISKFVLCKACSNPETDIIVEKDGSLIRACKACGRNSDIDPRHKLASYIAKNPPSQHKSKKKAATASASTGSNFTDLGASKPTEESKKSKTPEEEDGYDNDAITKMIQAEVDALAEVEDDDNWTVDLSEEAVKARQREAELGVAGINLNDDKDSLTVLGEWVTEEKPNDVEIYKKMVELGVATDYHAVQVLAQVLFDEDIINQIEEHEGILLKTVTSEKHENALLGGIERLVGLNFPELIPAIPKILMKLYDADLVSEESFDKWGAKASKKYVDKEISKKVKKAARPFLEWLAEAESESEEESDDE
ncbi:hypothetical protein NADFUDRAFT_81789 [Nadsonia fulvescens var. elongata DSM 6958]|uniref:W2 domain-containing protein n=1 Tax=Nadsonia fulvescens var. elongata DSM 6958 TaxID=857566 RepID=A0A1E3PP76_9ASCO|nr:hypothetical protein NADFUDRAFT_81789 [Nadsonia fulvescens var. elongata DSM 6958]